MTIGHPIVYTEERCVWCGRTYANHDDYRLPSAPVPRVPCLLLKSGFSPKTEKETEQ